jgi:alpha-N-arabinofuranosidase
MSKRPAAWRPRLAVVLASVTFMLAPERVATRTPAASHAQASGPAAVQNGSFEQIAGNNPAGWKTAVWQRAAEFFVDHVAHTGSRSVRISSREGGDASWTTIVSIRPYARYRLTGWIRTDGVDAGTGMGALLNLHGLGRLRTTAVTGTEDWTRVELEFDSEANDSIQINCLLGGWGRSRGTAWYDDIGLDLLSARELKPSVAIDASVTRAPISKYIYGQFIEHLGRCIYGGIWAEMIEDRKFFHPVGDTDSPWSATGEPRSFGMNKTTPFVGAQTPEIGVWGIGKGAGISQAGLALVARKAYAGRIVLAGESAAAPIEVSLVWGDGPNARQTIVVSVIDDAYRTTRLRFTAGASSAAGRLEITSRGKGMFRVGTVSLMPADNVEGFRPDVLQLLRELDAPIYRWPGGNFVSGYNWRDGIGDRDHRPPRKNPAWQGIEPNDVGIHEFLALCRLIRAEPYIAVNSGLGDAASAGDEVEYVNGAAATAQGRLRAANGHPDPFNCTWWSVGNEMYGNWQLGHMPIADYVKKHEQFAAAMRARDPRIRLVAVGAVGAWDEAMLAGNAASMDLISEHFYVQERPGLMGHVGQVPNAIRAIAAAHRRYREQIPALSGRNLQVALDEWNYWYGPHIYGELGTRYFLKDALGIAAGLHEYARQSDIFFMANYAQTVNVIGAIKTTKTAAAFDTTGVVLKLYRARFGAIPVKVEGTPEPLDVAAAWREPGRTLTVAIVNPTATDQSLDLRITGGTFNATAHLWRVSGASDMAYNEPGRPLAVDIKETPSLRFGDRVVVPPVSISIFELRVR